MNTQTKEADAIKSRETASDIDLDLHFAGLVQKFDRLSVKGKRAMIEDFDTLEIRLKIEHADAPEVVKAVVDEMKAYLQKRLPNAA